MPSIDQFLTVLRKSKVAVLWPKPIIADEIEQLLDIENYAYNIIMDNGMPKDEYDFWLRIWVEATCE